MSVVIQISEQDSERAFGILVRHSPGTALPDRTYILSEDAVQALRDAGIEFREIARGSEAFDKGAFTGERI